jgi:hypothetical protein
MYIFNKKDKAIKRLNDQKNKIGAREDCVNATWAAFSVEMIKNYFGEDSYIFEHSKAIGLSHVGVRSEWLLFLDEAIVHIRENGVYSVWKDFYRKSLDSIADNVGKYLSGLAIFIISFTSLITPESIIKIINAFICH